MIRRLMHLSNWHLSVRSKLRISALVVLVPIAAFIYFYVPQREQRIVREAVESRTANMAEFVALGVGRGLYLNEFTDVVSAINWVRQDSSLAYVVVVDTTGTVFASYNPDSIAVDFGAAVDGVRRTGDRLVTSVPIVYQERRMGTLLLGVSLRITNQLIDRERQLALLVSLVVLVLGLGVSRYFGNRITKPILELQEAAGAVARGDFTVAIPNTEHDEVGLLAAGFNTMVVTLRESTERANRMVEDLAAARDAARASERAKAYFLAAMSHEIRTPMNGVMGMLELLNGTGLEPRQRRFADTAYRSAEALLDVINEILDFSKIEAGHVELHHSDFDLCQSIEDVCEMLAPRAHEKGVDLITRIAPDLHASVHGDLTRVRQVLINLVSNAIKFTAAGSVQVRVTADAGSLDQQMFRFEVQDSGIGIAPHVATQLFTPFVQADASTTRQFGGTGLGLAISRQLVELLGGQIGVESQPGVGSTFFFTIPLDLRPTDTEEHLTPQQALSGRRVLVIDDNATNREVLREQLGAWGALVDEAPSGAEGLEQLRAGQHATPYDVIILDYTMPEMDGGVVARRVRANPDWNAVPILLLSSIGGTSHAAESAAPVDAVLTKPARQRELAERLTMLVKGTANARTASRTRAGSDVQATARDGHQRPPLNGLRVLLAEDNPVNQRVAGGFLEGLGCCVAVASNGREAVHEATSGTFDVVLMDCMMPEMDGYAATQSIRQWESSLSIRTPIIALTASAMDGERERCLAAGMDDYLSKPFRLHELTAMLERWTTARPAVSTDASKHEADAVAVAIETAGARVECRTIDVTAIDSIRKFSGGARILAESVDAYLRTAPDQLDSLRLAIAADNRQDVCRVAHTLKSSSALLGAAQLAKLMRELELQAHELPSAELERLCTAADATYRTNSVELAQYVDG